MATSGLEGDEVSGGWDPAAVRDAMAIISATAFDHDDLFADLVHEAARRDPDNVIAALGVVASRLAFAIARAVAAHMATSRI